MSWTLSLLMGIVGGVFAATSAFLIVHDSLRSHRMERRQLWRESLLMAGFAFVFFMGVSLLAGYWLGPQIQ